jgi:hypothetical protein
MQTMTFLPALRPPSLMPYLGRNRFVIGAAILAAVAAAAAWQWSWLIAIGVAPLLISVAPCAAMCALGLCMHRVGRGSCSMANTVPPNDPQRIGVSPDQTVNQGNAT